MKQMLEMPEEARPITVPVRCGDCIHYHSLALFSDGRGGRKPCSGLGRAERSYPCSHFSANPFGFNALKDDALAQLYRIIPRLNRRNVALLAAILGQESRTAAQGFRFGEVVYVRILPDDYLSNYASARVIKANPDHVFLQGGRDGGYHATITRPSVLKLPEWHEKRTFLVREGKLVDPRSKEYFGAVPNKEKLSKPDHVVPTLEEFQNVGLTSVSGGPVVDAGRRRANAPPSPEEMFRESLARLSERPSRRPATRITRIVDQG